VESRIRLVALDIDGTLLDSQGNVPDANRDAIARAIASGVEIVLATGRRYEFARSIFERLPPPLTLILSNGAIVKTREGETLIRSLLPREIARAVLRRAPAHRDTAAVVFDRPDEGQVVFEAIDWNHPRHGRYFAANRRFLSEAAPLESCLTEDPVQVMFTGGCAAMRALFVELGGRLPAASVRRQAGVETTASGPSDTRLDPAAFEVALTEYQHRDFSLVDVVRAGCTKGSALAAWAASRGLSADQVMAVGDNLNDLQMLEFAGTPVLMGNAVAELKARGWPVTLGNDESGVARAIDTYVFGP
jgi:hydroxymethylpyrimidine pyrophosphatase-like HAD family hydrolase